VDSTSSTVGGEDGGTDVTVDLGSSQGASLSAPLLPLQRLHRAIPALMPSDDGAASACDVMASSECVEGASGVTWNVLEKDVMLGVGAEV